MIGHLTLWTVTGSGVPVSSMDVTLTISDISMAHCWPILLSRSRSVTSPEKDWPWSCKKKLELNYHQVKARRALLQFKDVLLRTRRVLLVLSPIYHQARARRVLFHFKDVLLRTRSVLLVLLPRYHQARAWRALLQFKDVLLRTRRVLSLYKVYGDRALLVFNGTSLNCNNALVALNWRYLVWNNKHNLWSVIKMLKTKLGWPSDGYDNQSWSKLENISDYKFLTTLEEGWLDCEL